MAPHALLRFLCLLGLVASAVVGYAQDSQVVGWGSDQYDALNHVGGGTDNVVLPTDLSISGAASVAAGFLHSLALKRDGSVWSWGNNEFGQLGRATTGIGDLPGQVPGLPTNVTWIGAGYGYSVALSRTGVLFAWGRTDMFSGSNPRAARRVSFPSPVVQVACGSDHLLALLDDGRVFALGHNNKGQLGRGTVSDAYLSAGEVQGLTNVEEVSASGERSMARTQDGQVYEWGVGEAEGISSTQSTPALVNGLPTVVRIAAGVSHGLALDSSGQIYGWGVGPANGRYSSWTKPGPVFSTIRFKAISAGDRMSLGIDVDGKMWTWGEEGMETSSQVVKDRIPLGYPGAMAFTTCVPFIKPPTAYSLGGRHLLAVTSIPSGPRFYIDYANSHARILLDEPLAKDTYVFFLSSNEQAAKAADFVAPAGATSIETTLKVVKTTEPQFPTITMNMDGGATRDAICTVAPLIITGATITSTNFTHIKVVAPDGASFPRDPISFMRFLSNRPDVKPLVYSHTSTTFDVYWNRPATDGPMEFTVDAVYTTFHATIQVGPEEHLTYFKKDTSQGVVGSDIYCKSGDGFLLDAGILEKAGDGGATIHIDNTRTDVGVIDPEEAKVPVNQTEGKFPIKINPVATPTDFDVTASSGGISKTLHFHVSPITGGVPVLYSVLVNKGEPAYERQSGLLTVRLLNVQSTDTTVSLASNSSVVSLPSNTVVIPAGRVFARAEFVAGLNPHVDQVFKITATVGSSSKAGQIQVKSNHISDVVRPAKVTSGQTFVITPKLSRTAGPDGVRVYFTVTGGTALTVPSSALIPAGKSSVDVVVKAKAVADTLSMKIGASTGKGFVDFERSISIYRPKIGPATLPASSGDSIEYTITLSAPVGTDGMTFQLSSTASEVTLPASVTVAAGQSTVTFTARVGTITANKTATIKADNGTVDCTAKLNLRKPGKT